MMQLKNCPDCQQLEIALSIASKLSLTILEAHAKDSSMSASPASPPPPLPSTCTGSVLMPVTRGGSCGRKE